MTIAHSRSAWRRSSRAHSPGRCPPPRRSSTRTSSSRSRNDRAADVKAILARGVDPNTVDGNGEPVLVVAARGGFVATVDVLLAGRADVNLAQPIRRHGADGRGAQRPSRDREEAARARRRGRHRAGWTALIYAATGGHDDVVRYLLAEGANINAASPNGTTALMMAVRGGPHVDGRAPDRARRRRQSPKRERRERARLGPARQRRGDGGASHARRREELSVRSVRACRRARPAYRRWARARASRPRPATRAPASFPAARRSAAARR